MDANQQVFVPFTNHRVAMSDNNTVTADNNLVITTEGNNVVWTNTSPPPNLISTGINMPSSFVSDQFVQVNEPNASHPLYQRMTEKELTGAQLHPLLKTVIKEANSLEQEKKTLLKAIENLKTELSAVRNELSSNGVAQDRINDLEYQKGLLEKRLSNQEFSLDALQKSLINMGAMYSELQQKHFDYSEESVNEIIEDYKVQLAFYETALRDYENASPAAKADRFMPETLDTMYAKIDDNAKQLTPEQLDAITAAFRRDLEKVTDPNAQEVILKNMNSDVSVTAEEVFTQNQVDKLIEDAKFDLLAKQDASVSHEEKFMELGPGVKVWQATTGRGPFLTQVLKPYPHKDKQATTSIGWLVRNEKGREEHFPIGDLTTKEPVRKGPNKLAHLTVGAINAVAMQLIAVQALGLKAVIPMAVVQTLLAAFTYRDVFKASK